jgi:hypothetical protein
MKSFNIVKKLIQDEEDECLSVLFTKSLNTSKAPAVTKIAKEYEDSLGETYQRLKAKSFSIYDISKANEFRIIFQNDPENEKIRFISLSIIELRYYLSLTWNRLVSENELLLMKSTKKRFSLKKIQKLNLTSFIGIYKDLCFGQCFDITMSIVDNSNAYSKDIREVSLIFKDNLNKILITSLLIDLSQPEKKEKINLSRIFASSMTRYPALLSTFIEVVSFFDSRNGQLFDEKAYEAVKQFSNSEIKPYRNKINKDETLIKLLSFLDNLKNANGSNKIPSKTTSSEVENNQFKGLLKKIIGPDVI